VERGLKLLCNASNGQQKIKKNNNEEVVGGPNFAIIVKQTWFRSGSPRYYGILGTYLRIEGQPNDLKHAELPKN
jgi:hypothetical protein